MPGWVRREERVDTDIKYIHHTAERVRGQAFSSMSLLKAVYDDELFSVVICSLLWRRRHQHSEHSTRVPFLLNLMSLTSRGVSPASGGGSLEVLHVWYLPTQVPGNERVFIVQACWYGGVVTSTSGDGGTPSPPWPCVVAPPCLWMLYVHL